MASSIKSASIYFRRGFYYVYPLAGSGGGDPCLFVEPVIKLPADVDSAGLGAAVLQSLSLSHHCAPWPTDWKNVAAALYSAAGVKSESTFMKGATSVRIDLDGGMVTLMPSTSKAVRNNLTPQVDKIVRLPLASAADIGAAVSRAVALAD